MSTFTRRDALKAFAAAGVSGTAGCMTPPSASPDVAATGQVIVATHALGAAPWPTVDPFLFCVHHDDRYPAGNDALGPAASLEGRNLGMDFSGREGWRMYHGRVVPGFPAHPHRGFETITVVRRGFLDHADSLGASARYGHGDVQWLTAGSGIQHAEMFPLLRADDGNHVELFQLWLNLASADKFAPPAFSMIWADQIQRPVFRDENGRLTRVTVIAGRVGEHHALAPPPHSWAARPDARVAIYTAELERGARWTLEAVPSEVRRLVYFFRGPGLTIAGTSIAPMSAVELRANVDVTLQAAMEGNAEVLILEGRPIGERVARRGPFVMNTDDELRQAFRDYRQSAFGGWPWGRNDPTHGRAPERFARHPDGRVERPS